MTSDLLFLAVQYKYMKGWNKLFFILNLILSLPLFIISGFYKIYWSLIKNFFQCKPGYTFDNRRMCFFTDKRILWSENYRNISEMCIYQNGLYFKISDFSETEIKRIIQLLNKKNIPCRIFTNS